MLEESIQNYDKNQNPTEIALLMLSFLQSELPAGGTIAETRFIHTIYIPLCNCIFGPILLCINNNNDNNHDNQQQQQQYRHLNNGWLSTIHPWNYNNPNNNNNNNSHGGFTGSSSSSSSSISLQRNTLGVPSPSKLHLSMSNHHHHNMSQSLQQLLDSDPVVKLLGTAGGGGSSSSSSSRSINNNHNHRHDDDHESSLYIPMTFIEAITKESYHRPSITFPFPFYALPQSIQDAYIAFIQQQQHFKTNTNSIRNNNNTITSSSSSLSLIPTKDDNNNNHQQQQLYNSSRNDIRLFGQLLRKGPTEQNSLLTYIMKNHRNKSQSNTMNRSLSSSLRSPSNNTISASSSSSPVSLFGQYNNNNKSNSGSSMVTTTTSTTTDIFYDARVAATTTKTSESPDILLSMLEYYLVLFIRFPLYAPEPTNKTVSSSSSIPGVHVHRISPPTTTNTMSSSSSSMIRETFGETLYYHLFRRYMRHYLPYDTDDPYRSITLYNHHNNNNNNEYQESEMFLRLIIALWLEGSSRLTPTPIIVQSIIERRRHRAGLIINETGDVVTTTKWDLDSSFDLTQTMEKYVLVTALPNLAYKCLRALIIHVMLDPAVDRSTTNCNTTNLDISTTRRTFKSNSNKLCISPCQTILQQPIYNYIRSTFRFAPIHSSSESSFYGALNIWLIWLEPWNVTQARSISFSAKTATQHIMGTATGNQDLNNKMVSQRALSIPRFNQPSKYVESDWEYYIAANVYMYAVPLAIFLRRARELDFSPKKYERSLETVQRVFRVFTPTVIDAISRHLEAVPHLEEEEGGEISYRQVKYHRENLGVYAPPFNPTSLSSLKADMQSLLEEVIMHHVKKVRELDAIDWLVGKVEGLFGAGVVSGEEKTLEALMERAQVITRMPFDFNILHSSGKSKQNLNDSSTTTDITTRTNDGKLTDVGREQLVAGNIKLSPDEVQFYGDPMRMKVSSYEIPFLVDLTLWASDSLNEYFGFSNQGKGQFRINLRFFADYRNSFFVATMVYILLWLF